MTVEPVSSTFSAEFFPQLVTNGFLEKGDPGEGSGKSFPVIAPASGARIGQVPEMGAAETRAAIARARASLDHWRGLLPKARAEILMKWHGLIRRHAADLAYIIHCEQGKSLQEAGREVVGALAYVEWYAEEAKRTYGDTIPTTDAKKRMFSTREPLGVVAAITPWNFPLALVVRKCAPALAAGCTVVLKPSEETPFSAIALLDLAARAGLPDGVLSLVFGRAEEIGQALCDSPEVRGLSFTGSTAVGRQLMSGSAATVKKLSMELGGNAPFIIFDDADVEAALEGLIASKFRNGGQTCVAANRIFVHGDIYERFIGRLVAKVMEGGDAGPLINRQAVVKMTRLVEDAERKGAVIRCGGRPRSRPGFYFQPTVLSEASPEMACFDQEIFGPVAALYRFSDEAAVLELANRGAAGLAAYVYTESLNRAWRFQERLAYGVVGINVGTTSCESAPFGGLNQSGLGREGGREGIDFYLETKYTCLGVPG